LKKFHLQSIFFENNHNPKMQENLTAKHISYHSITPVAGSIFGPLSQTHFSKSEFKNEISSSALLDIQITLLCVCGVDSFIPELQHLIEKLFHGLFSKKKPLKSDSWIQIHEIKLRSTFFRREKLSRRDYLKNEAKSGDMAVLQLTFRKVSLGKWSKN